MESFGDLSEIFVVSQVYFLQQGEAQDCFAEEADVMVETIPGARAPAKITVRVVRPRGSKCPRCWNYREDLVETSNLCSRCHEATH